MAPALWELQPVRESGPTGLASLSPVTAHCRTARMIFLTMFLQLVPPFQVCLCLRGSWLSLLLSLKRPRCSLYYG